MAFLWIHVPIIRIWYSNLRKCYIKMLYISYKFTIMKEVLIIMWIADGWKEYEVIDTSKGEKLERWGDYLLVRPDPQVIWDTPRKNRGWKHMNGHYHRSSRGGGEWEFFDLPHQWELHYKDLTFNLKPFSFKHTGLFPEQAVNWDWFRYSRGRFQGYGELGKRECCCFRTFRCADPLACG